MQQTDINRLEMLVATQSYLESNANVWNTIPLIARYNTMLSDLTENLRSLAQDQDAAQVHLGGSLQELKMRTSEKMDMLDDLLEAYADYTDNSELLAKAANTKSDYLRLPHEEFESKVKNMLALLDVHVGDMADYGATTDMLNDVKQTFGSFQQQRGKPRSYQIASRTATASIKDTLNEASDLVVKLDKVMKRFRRANASFYHGYQAARKVVRD